MIQNTRHHNAAGRARVFDKEHGVSCWDRDVFVVVVVVVACVCVWWWVCVCGGGGGHAVAGIASMEMIIGLPTRPRTTR